MLEARPEQTSSPVAEHLARHTRIPMHRVRSGGCWILDMDRARVDLKRANPSVREAGR
jgi:hypothetical protein